MHLFIMTYYLSVSPFFSECPLGSFLPPSFDGPSIVCTGSFLNVVFWGVCNVLGVTGGNVFNTGRCVVATQCADSKKKSFMFVKLSHLSSLILLVFSLYVWMFGTYVHKHSTVSNGQRDYFESMAVYSQIKFDY